MLVLSRQRDETVMVGDDIEVTVVDIRGDKVRLGFNHPKEIAVHRKEVYDAIRRGNRAARKVLEAMQQAPSDDLLEIRAERVAAASNAPPPTPPGLTIRHATELDLDAINAIYNHYVATSTCTYQEHPEPIDSRQQWLAAGHGVKHPVMVATLESRLVGWGSLSPFHSRSAFRNTVESSVYVHHEFHRQGIGSALLADLIQRARAIGHHVIIAAIDGEQKPSLVLHERFGFQRCSHMKQVGFKFGRWLDVVDMQLML